MFVLPTYLAYTYFVKIIFFSGIRPSARSKPGLGPVLPRIPSHQPPAPTADVTRAAVREHAPAQLSRPRAGRARLLRAHAGPHTHRAHTKQSAGELHFV